MAIKVSLARGVEEFGFVLIDMIHSDDLKAWMSKLGNDFIITHDDKEKSWEYTCRWNCTPEILYTSSYISGPTRKDQEFLLKRILLPHYKSAKHGEARDLWRLSN